MLTSEIHAYLDYLTVIIFGLAPSVFALSKTGTLLAYTLALIHLVMTALTAFPGGWVNLVPFSLHGYVELTVGIILTIIPWLTDDLFSHVGQPFFSVMGFIILVVYFFTSYKSSV